MATTSRKAELLAAANTVKAAKSETMMTLRINGTQLVLPYADGLAIMQHLERAEKYDEGWRERPPEIRALKADEIVFSQITAKEVKLAKMAQLLNVSIDDLMGQLKAEDLLF